MHLSMIVAGQGQKVHFFGVVGYNWRVFRDFWRGISYNISLFFRTSSTANFKGGLQAKVGLR